MVSIIVAPILPKNKSQILMEQLKVELWVFAVASFPLLRFSPPFFELHT